MADPIEPAPNGPAAASGGAEGELGPGDAAGGVLEGAAGAAAGPARTPAAAAGEALRALAHVARSFVLYDASNERIRGFLEDVRAKVERFLATYGEMRLEIRPWDIVFAGDVVYSERDRERSLAFRLYRDGVRRLTLNPGLEWEELIVLIGILSIRYKGVRTQEDDVVTLLWRADFRHIEISAVEGVVASEDDTLEASAAAGGAAAGPRDAVQALAYRAPYAFNYPWPGWAERASVERRPVPAELLARITDEDGARALPDECLQLVRELLAALTDPFDPLSPGDVAPVLFELRGFLVGDHCLEALVGMARMTATAPNLDDDIRKELLAACVDDEVMRRCMAAADPADERALAELEELARLAPGEHLSTFLDMFVSSPKHRDSPVVRRLLESQLAGRAGQLTERLAALEAPLAVELFRMLAKADAAGAVDAAVVLLARTEPEAQLEAVRFLDTAEYSGKVGRALVGALTADVSGVRQQALATLVRRRERRAFDPLLTRMRSRAADLPAPEAATAGEAMATLDPEKARPIFKEWVRPSGLLGRLTPGQATLRRAAAAGLALLPGGDSEELLEWLARHAGDDLGRQCEAALARLREKQGNRRG
ncbi:MAG TPA: hypothetical protein VMT19_04720 [Thermoanaerobaculaceae bacterium]|nr:hypothetical protein [Thermoanaerobaculaceae bacterium]